MYRRLVGPFVLLVAALAALAAVRPDGAASPAAEARPVEPPRVENELRLANGRAVKSLESPRMLAAADGVRSAVHGAPGDTLLRARLAADSLPVAAGLDAAWKELGPKPYVTDHPDYLATNGESFGVVSGRITSLAVDPTNPDIVFAGAAGGGVWRTADAGDHWTPIGDTLPTMAVGAVALDPNDPHTVFVGTGESNTGGDNIYGSGVYRSHDDGGTWERVAQNIASEATVAHIEVSGDRVFVASSKGLWRSDDKGDTYANVLLPTNAAGTAPDGHFLSNIVSDVKVKPDDPNEVTAAVGWRKGVKSGSTPGALYRSTTGGAPGSFTRMAPTGFGSPSPNAQSTDPVGRVTLAYAKGPQQNPDVLWAVIQDAGVEAGDTFVGSPLPPKYTSLNGVYRSQDDGATWALKATSAELAATPFSALSYRLPLQYGPGIQSWYDQWIAVDPTDENRVLLGLEEIYQSLPGANAPAGLAGWTTVGRYNNLCLIAPCDPTLPGPVLGGITTHPDQHAFAFAPLPGGGVRLYAGNDGGVWRQDAQAVTGFDNEHWTSTNKTMGTTQPYSAVMGGDGTVWLGLQDNGTAKITPTGEGIEANGGDGFDVAVDPKNSDIAFGELPYGDLQKTTDGGKNWSGVAPSVTGAQFDAPIEIDPRDAKHVVFAGKQLFESADGGDTVGASWQQSFDTGYNDAGKANNSITAVGVEGTAVYAGFCGLCDVITDGRGDVTRFHNGLATNVKDGCAAKAGGTECWHFAAASGLPNRLITDLAVDQQDPATVWAALGGYSRRGFAPPAGTPGVGAGHLYVSHDRGEHFVDVSGNLPDVVVNSVTLRDSAVILGTDVGVFVGSKALGSGFARLGMGMPNAPAWRTNLNPDGSKLVVATHGRGVWMYDFNGAASLGGSARPPAGGAGGGSGVIPATGRGASWPAVLGCVLLAAGLVLRRRWAF